MSKLKPILKWVGGKRQLLSQIIPLIPKHNKYIEPFIGGGAVLFDLAPKKAVISDFNSELINLYKVIKTSPKELVEVLKTHADNNSNDHFYNIRSLDREESFKNLSDVEKAARIVYLNKTCFNGLYRVNSLGFFNSPYGKYKNPKICDEELIYRLSEYFNKNDIKIFCQDYKETLKEAKKGDFVYLDPPYMPISISSSFTGYTENGFSYKCQEELRDECVKLKERGVSFIQSNSDCPEIRELYKDFKIISVEAKRNINSKGDKRGPVGEVLICSGI